MGTGVTPTVSNVAGKVRRVANRRTTRRRTAAEIATARKRSHTAWVYRLRTVYGITEDEYNQIKEAQGGVCFICRWATGKYKRLCVDHDHKTGFIRGLLCNFCNKLLGKARDSVDFFQRCIDYLTSPPAFAVIGERAVPNTQPEVGVSGA